MRPFVRIGLPIASALVVVACGHAPAGANQTGAASGTAANDPLLNSDTRPQPTTATGCLTASGGRYVVTVLDQSTPVPTTTTYQLTSGATNDLQQNVNREVRVAGEADAPRVADVREAPTPAVGTSGQDTHASDQQPQPRVSTQESMRFVVRDLKVLSVTPTGDPCPAAATSSQSK